MSEKNIHLLDVATQLNNADACKFYERLGFNITRTENIYHIWL
jgi:dTDP-4-amino-4,6-dideoxy-D-galactose acyltransferase